MNHLWENSRGGKRSQAARASLSQPNFQTLGAFMTWPAMCGSGVGIQNQKLAALNLCAVAVGLTAQRVVATLVDA